MILAPPEQVHCTCAPRHTHRHTQPRTLDTIFVYFFPFPEATAAGKPEPEAQTRTQQRNTIGLAKTSFEVTNFRSLNALKYRTGFSDTTRKTKTKNKKKTKPVSSNFKELQVVAGNSSNSAGESKKKYMKTNEENKKLQEKSRSKSKPLDAPIFQD